METLIQLFNSVKKISTDTRFIEEGSMFFALKGANFDGNLFAKQAIEKGAAYAVIDNPQFAIEGKTILVDDVLKAMQNLARTYRDSFNIPVIGITGSNGKTTTKELMVRVLSKKYKCHATKGNLNNHIGVPITLLSMPGDTEIAIIELGANKAGDNWEVCQISNPNFGIITNNGKDHLEGFGSEEGVIKANKELYDYLGKVNGHVFLHAEDDSLTTNIGNLSVFTYGNTQQWDVYGKITKVDPFISVEWSLKGGADLYSIKTSMIGTYNLPNILCAIAVGIKFGIEPTTINKAIEEYIPSNNRSQLVNAGTNQIIMDAYNANPSSMRLAIENILKIDHPNKILILGSMAEMGEYAHTEHHEMLGFANTHRASFKNVVLIGKEFYEFKDQFPFQFFPDSENAINYLKSLNISNALVLVKGSRSMKLENVVKAVFNA